MNNNATAKHQPIDLKHESDRGAVLIVAAVLENTLEKLITMKLIQLQPKVKDDLFQGGSSAIGTFSAKIELSFRLGLITDKQKKMFNIFRKLRNEFAHSSENISFATSSIEDRLKATYESNPNLRDQLMIGFEQEKELKESFLAKYLTSRKIFETLYEMEIKLLNSKMEFIVRVELLPL